MATRRLNIRVSTENTDQTERDLDRLGTRGSAALGRIGEASTPASKGLIAVDKAASGARGTLEGAARTQFGGVPALLSRIGVVGLSAAGAVAAAGAGITSLVRSGDQIKVLEGRFKALTGDATQAGQAVDNIFRLAADTGASIDGLGQQFARFTIAGERLGATQQDVAELVEVVSKLGAVGGASAQELESGAVQLAQGLASGVLQGDELRSVLEQMPLVAKAIADELGVGVGALRDMGAEGEITSELVFEALLGNLDKAREQFEDLPVTVERASSSMAAAWTKFTAELDKTFGVSEKIVGVLDDMRDRVEGLGEALGPVSIETQLARLQRERAAVADPRGAITTDIQNLRASGTFILGDLPGTPEHLPRKGVRDESRLRELDAEIAALELAIGLDRGRAALAAQLAAERKEAAAAENAAAAAAEKQKESDKVFLKLVEDRNATIAKNQEKYRELQRKGLEDAAKEAEKIAAAEEKRETVLKENITSLERGAQLAGLSKDLRAQEVELDRARARAGRELSAIEERRIRNAVEIRTENEAALAAQERSARELENLLDRAGQNIQNTLAGGIRRAFDGEIGTVRGFFDEIKNLALDAAANITAALVFRPVINAGLSAVGGSGLVSGLAGGAAAGGLGGFGNIAGGFGLGSLAANGFLSPGIQAGIGNAVLGAGLGAGAANFAINAATFSPFGFLGGLGANALGLGGGAGGFVGGTLGSLAGGGIGGSLAALGAFGGPIGAIAGGFLGTALGGAFGGSSSVGPAASQRITIANGRAVLGASGAADGGELGPVQQEAQAVANALNALAAATGGTLSTNNLTEGNVPGGNLRFVTASLRGGITRGSDEVIRDALLAGVLQGVSPAIIDTALTHGIQAAIDGASFAGSIDDLILAITDPLGSALKQLEADQAVRLEIAKAGGADIAKVEQFFALERQQIVERFNEDLTQGLAGAASTAAGLLDRISGQSAALSTSRSLTSTIQGLRFGSTSPLGVDAQLAEARGLFAREVGLAQGGDAAAAARASSLGSRVVDLSRQFNASGPAFVQDFDSVVGTLTDLARQFTVSAGGGSPDVVNALAAQTDSITTRLDALIEAQGQTDQELRRLQDLVEASAA